ncbi:MAG: hypothetical protein AB7G28_07590 [Pirellulales bacterium]
MKAVAVQECESVARTVAIWGSIAAAFVFGIGFVSDSALSYYLVSGQAVQIALVLLIFLGYWLAWSTRFEVPGSALALAAVVAYWFWCRSYGLGVPSPIFMVVTVPALFHLAAVTMHRLALAVERRGSHDGV